MVVGECGISPDYFYHRLTFNEAILISRGHSRNNKTIFEAARMLHGIIGRLFAKDYQLPVFPWDKDYTPPKPYTEDEINDLRLQAQEFANRLNSKN